MAESTKFTKLFEPGTIGKFKIKNRIIRVAAGTDYIDEEAKLKLKPELPYFEALAKGGVGLMIIGATTIYRMEEKHIPGYKALTDMIHKYNIPVFAQHHHGGAWVTRPRTFPPVVSASAIPLEELKLRGPEFPIVPKELTIPEIKEIIAQFATVAERDMRAGFDGVEINAATCHLGNSFLSRAWNRRQDEYGCQNLENRARFVIEIKDEMQKRIGKDVPVGVLINGAEFGIKDGLTLEETQGFAKIFEKEGFAYINVRVYGYIDYFDLHLPDSIMYPEPPNPVAPPLDISHKAAGISVSVAAAIKKAVTKVPVFTVGKLDAALGEQVLQEGKADFIGLGRRLIADPLYVNKVAEGRMEDITPCIFCLRCFGMRVDYGMDIKCSVNGATGLEEDYAVKPASKKKKIMIIGAGPAGMEAARVAAVRGHDVTIYDKRKKLGGLVVLANMIKGFIVEDLEGLLKYYNVQLPKLGVKVNLGTEATAAMIEQAKPDVIIVATGGTPNTPKVPGLDKCKNILTVADLHRQVKGYLDFFGPKTLRSLTKFYMPVGKRVIVMGVDGGLHSHEMAEFLVKRGRQVTILDTAKTIDDSRLPKVRNVRLAAWLAKKGVPVMTEVKYNEVTDKGLTFTTKDGKKQTLEADNIIPVMPWLPNPQLFNSLKGKAPEVYAIGDCKEPGLILEAIGAGHRLARIL
ncbi:MAG: NAD(P)/FAD-dependent oxidoreductase [Chloroflexota bacterium]